MTEFTQQLQFISHHSVRNATGCSDVPNNSASTLIDSQDTITVRNLQVQKDKEKGNLWDLNISSFSSSFSESETTSLKHLTSVKVKIAKLNLQQKKKQTKQVKFKQWMWRQSISDLILSVVKRVHYKEWVKKENLYCTKNYSHFQQFVHQIEQISFKGCLSEVKHYLNYKIAEC